MTERTSAPVALPTGTIVVGERQRPLNPARVANLEVSMRENGFFGAILVRPIATSGSQFRLVVGRHRLQAWRNLGHQTIPAHVRILTDDEALQIEIDENLIREDLNPLERAEAVAARLVVWRRRFPDRVVEGAVGAAPKRGRPKNSDKLSEFLGDAPETMGFAADTAAQLDLNKRTIERALQVVTNVPAAIRARLHGTPIARNDGVLRQLAAIGDPKEQAAVAEVLISGKTKNVADARAFAAGNTPSKPVRTPADEAVKAFAKLWGKASPSARAAILHDLAGRPLPKGWIVREDANG